MSNNSQQAPAKAYNVYPVGTPGTPWGSAERAEWLGRQARQRDYFTDVVSALHRLGHEGLEVFQYGELDYRRFGAAKYPLYGARTAPWAAGAPMVLVTGGVHGYETSGVHGALLFLQRDFPRYSGPGGKGVNVLVLPCVAPWGYEVIHRWTPEAVDPNRQFVPEKPGCPEAAAAMACVAEHAGRSRKVIMHTDLHETTDSDNSEFRPALFARDGKAPDPFSEIPDGFFLVANGGRPVPAFQKALIDAVRPVTHIAPADEAGAICGEPVVQAGVINVVCPGICGNHSTGTFTATTEVYPDSPKCSAEQCNQAQAAVICAGIEYAVAHHDEGAAGATE
jgi:hypothetical protein